MSIHRIIGKEYLCVCVCVCVRARVCCSFAAYDVYVILTFTSTGTTLHTFLIIILLLLQLTINFCIRDVVYIHWYYHLIILHTFLIIILLLFTINLCGTDVHGHTFLTGTSTFNIIITHKLIDYNATQLANSSKVQKH